MTLHQKGLGLARLREFALTFDGRLNIETAPGTGFRLRLTLPPPV